MAMPAPLEPDPVPLERVHSRGLVPAAPPAAHSERTARILYRAFKGNLEQMRQYVQRDPSVLLTRPDGRASLVLSLRRCAHISRRSLLLVPQTTASQRTRCSVPMMSWASRRCPRRFTGT